MERVQKIVFVTFIIKMSLNIPKGGEEERDEKGKWYMHEARIDVKVSIDARPLENCT